jgi:glycosyltransferase involved in cell wall biosynthesis
VHVASQPGAPGERRRRRILYLIDQAVDSGGAERFAIGLATRLPADRYEVWVCSTRKFEPAVAAALDAAGVKHLHLGRRRKLQLHRFAPLAQLMRRERFDILHSHMFGSNLWGALFGRAYRVPVIIAHEHNWAFSGEPARVWLDRHVIGRLSTRFIAVSNAQRGLMTTVEKLPAEQIVVLPTAYIPSKETAGTDVRAELALSPDTPLVGTAAILRSEKALDILIEAHAEVIRRIPAAHLVIAGEGDREADLRARADELGIADRVHLIGLRSDVDALLRAFDVGAMSSDWEGMPLFVFECMAAGTPLVATDVGGLPEIVEQGRTGILVPRRDPSALGAAIAGLLADPERGRELAAAAAQRSEQFTIEAVSRRFADLYDELLAEYAARTDSRPVSS